MLAVPADTPVITPVDAPTDTLALLLVHTPPVDTSLKVIAKPGHTANVVPVMAGNPFITVIADVVKQPAGVVNVIVAEPNATPVTIPVEEPTVATDVLPELQVP